MTEGKGQGPEAACLGGHARISLGGSGDGGGYLRPSRGTAGFRTVASQHKGEESGQSVGC